MKMINEKKTYKTLRTSNITTDQRYQRMLKEPHAERITGAFDWAYFGTPIVAQRPTGELVALDGQHRIAAANAAGFGDTPVTCEVHEGLTLADEAKVFRTINKDRIRSGRLDDHKAAAQGQDPSALEIERIVTRVGLRIGGTGITAVEALYYVHSHYNNLELTLNIVSRWAAACEKAETSIPLTGVILRAIGHFVANTDRCDATRLVNQLKVNPAADVLLRLRRVKGNRSVPVLAAQYAVLADIYGKRTRATRSTAQAAE